MNEDLRKALELLDKYEILVEKQRKIIELLRSQLADVNSSIIKVLTTNK